MPAGTGVDSAHLMLQAAMFFYLTDQTAWAEQFEKIFDAYAELATERGTWDFEHMIFIYSWFFKLVLVWDIVEEGGAFDDEARLRITNPILSLTRHVAGLPYFAGGAKERLEIRQDHPSRP